MKFIVTGGAGFIGSHISKFLIEQNHDVIVIDDLRRGNSNNLTEIEDKISFEKINILNFKEMQEIAKDIDGIFHQAGLGSVPQSFKEPEEYYKVNAIGTENILKLGQECNCKVVYASSSSVYGNQTQFPIKENFEKNPLNPYGTSKLQAEKFASEYASNGVKVIGLRYFNVFGKGQTGSYAGVITKFIEKIKHKEQPEIFGTGEQIRDFVFVEDVANANLLSMKNEIEFGFFNVGTGNSYSILEIANMIINAAKLKIEPKCLEPLPGDALLSQANIDLIKKSLKWEPKMDLKMWLEIEIPKILQTSS